MHSFVKFPWTKAERLYVDLGCFISGPLWCPYRGKIIKSVSLTKYFNTIWIFIHLTKCELNQITCAIFEFFYSFIYFLIHFFQSKMTRTKTEHKATCLRRWLRAMVKTQRCRFLSPGIRTHDLRQSANHKINRCVRTFYQSISNIKSALDARSKIWPIPMYTHRRI